MPIPIDPGWLHFARLAPWRFAKTYPAMQAIFGWRTSKQAVLYTRSADHKALSGSAVTLPSPKSQATD